MYQTECPSAEMAPPCRIGPSESVACAATEGPFRCKPSSQPGQGFELVEKESKRRLAYKSRRECSIIRIGAFPATLGGKKDARRMDNGGERAIYYLQGREQARTRHKTNLPKPM